MSVSSAARKLSVVREAAEPIGNRTFRRGLSAKRVDASLRREVHELHRAEGSVLLWFAEMSHRKLYAAFGYATMERYATERLGFTENRAYRFERLAGELRELPRLRRALAKGEIGWTKIRTLIQVASPTNERSWLERAKRMGRRALEREVAYVKRRAMEILQPTGHQPELVPATTSQVATQQDPAAAQSQAPAPAKQEPADPTSTEWTTAPNETAPDTPITVRLRFTSLQLARYEAIVEKLRKGRIVSSAETREEILLQGLESLLEGEQEEGAVRADAPAAAPENPVSDEVRPRGQSSTPYQIVIYECVRCRNSRVQTGRGARQLTRSEREAASCDALIARPGERRRHTILPRIRNAVLERDGHQCRAPGCRRRRFLEIHHVRPRARGGSNGPDNLVTLCSTCHQLWHEHRWDIRSLRPVE